MDNSEIMVSVSCCVYNHEKYLRKCLDGFIMQKTDFKFEVLVHDDASTDSSPEIIREYEKMYPDIIKPIYQTENQYSKKVRISYVYQIPRAKGKYIAFCEGDDYWCDENKLQKQFDAMEKNPSCVFCACQVKMMREDGTPLSNNCTDNSLDTGIIPQEEMIKIFWTRGVSRSLCPFQTSGYFVRVEYIQKLSEEFPEFLRLSCVGDVPLIIYTMLFGDFYYIKDVMSRYRQNSSGSWSSRIMRVAENSIKHFESTAAYFKEYNSYTNYKYNDLINKEIDFAYFSIYLLKHDIHSLKDPEFKSLLRRLPLKKRIRLTAAVVCPPLDAAYQKLYGAVSRIRKRV